MKSIYLIRHGQSIANAKKAIQEGVDSGLTAKGKKEALLTAKILKHYSIEKIVSSPHLRGKETAHIISKELHLPIVECDLFIERVRPSFLKGALHKDKIAITVEKKLIANYTKPEVRIADEETFEDLKKRAKKALAYLKGLKEESIAVVTHGYFKRILLAYVIFGDKLTGEHTQQVVNSIRRTTNGGITTIRYNEKDSGRWTLHSFNSNSHLAKL